MEKDKLQELANSLYFKLDDEVVQNLEIEFKYIIDQFEKIKNIDVTNVKPLTHINENFTSYLREDIVEENENISLKDILFNSKDSTDQFVKIKQVLSK